MSTLGNGGLPHLPCDDDFCEYFGSLIDTSFLKLESVYCIGDFNVNVLRSTPQVLNF